MGPSGMIKQYGTPVGGGRRQHGVVDVGRRGINFVLEMRQFTSNKLPKAALACRYWEAWYGSF